MTPARPTVDADGLAELLAAHSVIYENDGGDYGGRSWFECICEADDVIGATEYATEDAHRHHVATVIAAHLAAVTAERDEARAAVERVEALAVQYEHDAATEGHGGELWSTTAAAIAAALSPAPSSNTEETP